ncbi:MAG TPA: ABC transporter permease [Gemmatimonadaceae bacterium]
MREWFTRLVDWFRRDQLEAELRDEIRFHQSALERDAHATDPVSARRRMGNTTRAIEESRDRWSIPWLDHLQQDVRYAVRGLRRSPGFAFGVIATLALGIGANAAMFSVVDRLMFRPYPMLHDPGTVHRVYLQWTERDARRTSFAFEYRRYLDFQEWTTSFSKFAAFFPTRSSVGSGEATRERDIAAVNASYFSFFDARPALGRFFTDEEDTTPVGAPVVVLGHGFWLSEFGGRDVIGQPLQIDRTTFTIIGVAPEGFTGVTEGSPRVAFIPITTFAGSQGGDEGRTYYTAYNWGWMELMVRRRPEVSVEAASRDLSNAYVRSWNTERELFPQLAPSEVAKPVAIAGPLKTSAGPNAGLEARTALWVTGVTLIVLLIACANVANLFLGRALRRRREVALRLALGVSRRRLAAQTMTESLVLSLIGCSLGVAVAQLGGMVLGNLFLPTGQSFSLLGDWRTLAVAVTAALFAAVMTGVVPAMLATRADLVGALKAGAREGTYHRSRTRSVLLVTQGALSMALLIGAGLFVRSLGRVQDMRLGYDAERLVMVRPVLRGAVRDDSARALLGARLLRAAQDLPEVEHAAVVLSVPFWSTNGGRLFVEGIDSVQRLGRITSQLGTADYFRTMGTRILRGRAFGEEDRPGAPRVAVISQGLANLLWPGREALGRCMRVGADAMPCTTVIGIAEDVVQNSLTDTRRYRYYLPLEQVRQIRNDFMMLRVRGNPSAQSESIRAALQQVMPGQAYITTWPLETILRDQRRSWEIGATLFVAFGGLALVVAAIGLYAVIGYNVAQRMHELGVRIALGARSADVVRLVVGQGMGFAVAGALFGGALAFFAARWVEPLLFDQSARDPVVFVAVAVILVGVAIMASSVPAFRATRADPNRTLRAE